VPVVLSKNSGAAEVLRRGALKCDFWDVDRMADQIVSLLVNRTLGETLCRSASTEIRALTWDAAARQCACVYGRQRGVADN
jgi:glycogen synthase